MEAKSGKKEIIEIKYQNNFHKSKRSEYELHEMSLALHVLKKINEGKERRRMKEKSN